CEEIRASGATRQRRSSRTQEMSSRGPLLADGDRQPVGIEILGDARTEYVLRRLDALDAAACHPRVELVEVGNAESRLAIAGRRSGRIRGERRRFALMQGERRSVGGELGPVRRF